MDVAGRQPPEERGRGAAGAAAAVAGRKLGITLDESVRRAGDQSSWEDQAARSADRYLASNEPGRALQVLHERRLRLPRSRLYFLEAEAYRLAGQPDEALQVAGRASRR